jgi:signal transduction histidine kinase
MTGQSITKIIPPELYQDEDRILSTIARGDRIEQFETVRVTKNDERVDVSLTVSPVRDEAGRIVGAAKIARNITQQKKAERALHMAERLASVGRLAATVAHEINNPLEAVMNFIFLAQRAEGLPQNARTYLALADEQLGRVSHIAQQTLGFYRDTSSPMLVNICEPLDDVLRVFENKLHYKSLVVDRSRFTELWIETLGGELRQILSNLISNAIDASTKNGVIRVRARVLSKEGGKFAHITVADQGTGISPEAKEVIFTPFFTTKRDVGTGLGLWATKGMIEKQGGRIAFRSKIGKGTVFTVDFPFRVSEVNSASVPTVTQFVAQESK